MKRRPTIQSNTYRFFVEGTLEVGPFELEDHQLAHQLGSVLRLQAGDQVLLLDNRGWQYIAILRSIGRGHVAGTLAHKELASGEPGARITLYLALMRPERFEWALQKGTELGVSAFVPLICERSAAEEVSQRKNERWMRIVREAAEQARRACLPPIAPALPFAAACAQAAQAPLPLLLWEGTGAASLRQTLRRRRMPEGTATQCAILSGPAGGFTPGELETARAYGMIAVTLGPRTLRAETAPLAAVAATLYELGDME